MLKNEGMKALGNMAAAALMMECVMSGMGFEETMDFLDRAKKADPSEFDKLADELTTSREKAMIADLEKWSKYELRMVDDSFTPDLNVTDMIVASAACVKCADELAKDKDATEGDKLREKYLRGAAERLEKMADEVNELYNS